MPQNWNPNNRYNDESIMRRGDDRTRGNYESRWNERSNRFDRDDIRRDEERSFGSDYSSDYGRDMNQGDSYRAGDRDAHRNHRDMAYGSNYNQGMNSESSRNYGRQDYSRRRESASDDSDFGSGFSSRSNHLNRARNFVNRDEIGTGYGSSDRDMRSDWRPSGSDYGSASSPMWGQERGGYGMNRDSGMYGSSDIYNQSSSFRDRGTSYAGNVGGSLYGSNDSLWNFDQNRSSNSRAASNSLTNYTGRGPKGYRRSDDRIKEEVSEALERHDMIDASEIEVDVKDGLVTLRGHVEDRRQKRMAEDAVEYLAGVKDVRNELTVDQSLFERAKAAIFGEKTEAATTETRVTKEKNPRH